MGDQKINILVTGGAGFIGSNLVKELLDDSRVGTVRVLDNLSNGYLENIKPFLSRRTPFFPKGTHRTSSVCLFEDIGEKYC